MRKTTEYRQCTLRKACSPSEHRVMVSYIPAKFAKLAKTVRLKQDDGQWEDGWVVEKIGAAVIESDLPDAHRAAKRHRDATGDSMPRRTRN